MLHILCDSNTKYAFLKPTCLQVNIRLIEAHNLCERVSNLGIGFILRKDESNGVHVAPLRHTISLNKPVDGMGNAISLVLFGLKIKYRKCANAQVPWHSTM